MKYIKCLKQSWCSSMDLVGMTCLHSDLPLGHIGLLTALQKMLPETWASSLLTAVPHQISGSVNASQGCTCVFGLAGCC